MPATEHDAAAPVPVAAIAGGMAPGAAPSTMRAFASSRPLSPQELDGAPVRWPRPSRLAAALAPEGRKAAAAMRALGLLTVGDLIEHLPTDMRQARTVAGLGAGEQATIAVEVRTIASRAVRRRGMRALVQASVFDSTGATRATFFNQPWLVERYPPGTRLLLHGKADGRGGFRVSHHAPASGAPAGPEGPGDEGAIAHYPASEGITSTQILTLMREVREALREVPEPLSAATRVTERMPDRQSALAAMHFPRAREEVELGRCRWHSKSC